MSLKFSSLCYIFLSSLPFVIHSFIPSSVLAFIFPHLPPTCSVTTLLQFSPISLSASVLLLHLLSPPLTPLVIMASSCYDKPRLNLFLSPLRQVLDIHQLFLCMRVCVSDRVGGISVHAHFLLVCSTLVSFKFEH